MTAARHRRPVRRLLAWLTVLCAVLGGTACAPSEPSVGQARAIGRPVQVAPPNPLLAAATAPALQTGPPTRVRIADIGVDTPLDALGLDAAGALVAPTDYQRAGWYSGGPAPGDTGPAVIAGHVDSKTGPAVFARLSALRAGALVEVERGGAWLTFRVTGVARFAKDAFPTTDVYGPTPGSELRLVTCGGTFNRRANSYRDNVVVYAIIVG